MEKPTQNFGEISHVLQPNGWSRHIWCVVLRNHIMDLHMSSLGTIVPEGPCCVFYASRCPFYWGLTHWFFTSTLIWYYTHNDTHHTQGVIHWVSATIFAELIQFGQDPKLTRPRTFWRENLVFHWRKISCFNFTCIFPLVLLFTS